MNNVGIALNLDGLIATSHVYQTDVSSGMKLFYMCLTIKLSKREGHVFTFQLFMRYLGGKMENKINNNKSHIVVQYPILLFACVFSTEH